MFYKTIEANRAIKTENLIQNKQNKRKGVRDLIFWVPPDRAVCCVSLVALLLLLLPLLRIAQYSVPWYDDLNYGLSVKNALDAGAGFVDVIGAAFECVRVQWYAWQGTYSSIFFMALMPAAWGEKYYFLGPVFLILVLTCSVYALMHVILKNLFGADRYGAAAVSAVTAALCVVLIHTSQAGFYWYNGGVHYVGMHSFLLLLAAVCVKLAYAKRTVARCGYMLLGALLAAVVAGSNYVTALQGILALALIALIVLIYKKNTCCFYIPMLLIYLFGFYKNVAAPGNRFRSASYVGWGYSPVMSVLRSFQEAFLHMGTFTGWMTVMVMLLLLPIIGRIVKKSKFEFRLPLVILSASFCLYATGFTPSLYSLGHAGLGRTLNAVKLTYQILLILNEIYLVGWLTKRFDTGQTVRGKMKRFEAGCPFAFYVLMAAAMLFVFATAPNQAGCYSPYGAYYYVHTGEAFNFHEEYQERVEALKSDEKDVVFKRYAYTPWMLCMGDLSENPDAEENQAVAAWYDKDSVAVK